MSLEGCSLLTLHVLWFNFSQQLRPTQQLPFIGIGERIERVKENVFVEIRRVYSLKYNVIIMITKIITIIKIYYNEIKIKKSNEWR